ncbi:MAG: DUF423 domain-containing protein [Firmicutes bacterium]|nr:DUF423 domain-containing protein [Alicyclobacillaceae bacterium]MCL6497610.1 DUF423 domain-containing protein [Bacillota bacterium]
MLSQWVGVGAVLGFLTVALGAFGAHGLRGRIPEERMAVYQTAVQYQMMHALALGWVGVLASSDPRLVWSWAGWLFVVGMVLFSGSLYALALTGRRRLGVVTPFGGVAFLAGWAAVAWGIWHR